MDVSGLRMREATVVAGIWLTYGVGGLGLLYVALTLGRPNRLALVAMFVFATVAGIGVSLLPRERIVRSRMREPFFLSWTMLDFAMLIVATLLDGGTASPLVLVFFIPVVFSSMSYPLASVVTVGVVSVLSYLAVAIVAGGSAPAYQIGFAIALACTAAMSAWQAQNHNRQHRALATVSRTDPLTGCLNRRGFEERAVAEIGAMRRRERPGAILMVDIDHFKPVNDTYGHAAGDELLCWVTRTLIASVRAADSVGRLGGDEFAVLFPEIDTEHALASAARIAAALAERAPASIGLAIYPDDGEDLEALTHRADMRLYGSRRGREESPDAEQQAAALAAATAAEQPEEGFGPANLWRATLDAMPARAAEGQRLPLDGATDGDWQSALLDHIDASVVVTDMTGVVTSWNGGAQALYGWSREEAVGRHARELMVPEDAHVAEQLHAGVIRDGRWDGELLVRCKDGSTFTAYVRNRLIVDDAGHASAIVGVAVDISARVAAENELLHSRDYAQAVTECMGEGLFTLDVAGRVTYVNRAAESLLGWSGEELQGQPIGELIHPSTAAGAPLVQRDCPFTRALSDEATVRVDDGLFVTRARHELAVTYTACLLYTSPSPRD